jgi:predicted ATPase
MRLKVRSLHVEALESRFRLTLATSGTGHSMPPSSPIGTLRYLALLAALHSPRPPELLALNEPETSLHPRGLEPLARQIIAAAARSQLVVVSHTAPLVDVIGRVKHAVRIELVKEDGETAVAERKLLDAPSWRWTS